VSRKDAFRVEGRVIENLSDRLCRVELPNGHRLLAHSDRKFGLREKQVSPGDQILVEVSPYDLSKARIISENC
jgi:translation initiation factor IF-1